MTILVFSYNIHVLQYKLPIFIPSLYSNAVNINDKTLVFVPKPNTTLYMEYTIATKSIKACFECLTLNEILSEGKYLCKYS